MSRRVITRSPHQINVVLHHDRPPLKDWNQNESMRLLKETPADPKQDPFIEIVKELDALIGLDKVKDMVYEIYALLYIQKCRNHVGLLSEPQVLHMVFKGNPGTGKTTVARILARLLREMGVLTKGHLIEVERADLVGEYIGHTANKTREMVKKALGGILFIDEAYSLARGGEKDFGKEAIDTLVKAMEDHKNDFVLILAGYEDEMEDFLRSNPGLPSRFPIQIDFPDYTVDQLLQISETMLEQRQYIWAPTSKQKLKQHLYSMMQKDEFPFSNARYVRNIVERGMRHHAVRLMKYEEHTREELMTLRPEDLKF
jgi:stage V sporulation protein K